MSYAVRLYGTKTEQVKRIWISFEIRAAFASCRNFPVCRILISKCVPCFQSYHPPPDINRWWLLCNTVAHIFVCECILSVSITKALHCSGLSYLLWSAGLKTACSMSTHHPGACNQLRIIWVRIAPGRSQQRRWSGTFSYAWLYWMAS